MYSKDPMRMSKGERIVALDTNVLVNALNEDSLNYAKARKLVSQVLEGRVGGVIAYQNLTEFYAVVTNPKILAKPLIAGEAIGEMENLLGGNIKLIFPNRNTGKIWLSILKKKDAVGQEVHDKFLAATLLSNGVKKIVTGDKKDFEGIRGLETIGLDDYLHLLN